MSIDSKTKLTMQGNLEKDKRRKMYLLLKLFSEKLQKHKCHTSKALVRHYKEDGICTDKDLYGKRNFILKNR